MSKLNKTIIGLTTVILFSGAIAFLPMTASAATLTQSQINAIVSLLQSFGVDQSTISNVQTALSGGTPSVTPAAWCHTFNTNLGVGNSGDDVKALRNALAQGGIQVSSGGEGREDLFEEAVASAVSAFQEKYRSEILTPAGLTSPTGYVGPRTRAKLNALYGCGVVTPPHVACTTDAKLCPDGKTYVSRTGPNCEFAACPAIPTQSSITVLSPNGGETWTKGTTQTVKWQDNTPTASCPIGATNCYVSPPAPKYYDIQLVSYYPPCTGNTCPAYPYSAPRTIAKGVYGSSYEWAIPNCTANNPCSSNFEIGAGSYTIQVCQAGSTTCDSSDSYFKIVSPVSSQPSITVLSPNGGEQWAKGSTQTIRWSSNNISRVSILLVPVNSVYSGIDIRTLAADVTNTSSYSWTIPNCTADNPCSSNFEIPNGSYYIRVVDPSNVGDDSNAPFSIVGSTSGLVTVALDPSTPAPRNVGAGSTDIEMTRVKLSTGSSEGVTISELWIGGIGNAHDLSSVSLYDGTTLLKRVPVYASSGSGEAIMVYFSLPSGLVIVPVNSSKVLSIKADIASTAQLGRSVALGVQTGKAVGINTGTQYSFNPNVTGNTMTIITIQPYIDSLSVYSGSVGTALEIRGRNFSGFESDLNAWIKNSQGVSGLLIGGVGSTASLIKVTLQSPLCQTDTSYSGLPCQSWLTLTPGVYKIYVMPWGVKSNEVSFTVVR